MTTISTSTNLGVVLTTTVSNPVVIESGVTITNINSSNVIHTTAGSTAQFTIENYGTVKAGAAGFGAYLIAGGAVTNAASASIYGGAAGIYEGPAGIVVNSGRIASGTLSSDAAITLAQGGSVTNLSSGSIIGGGEAVLFVYQPGFVVNNGFITAHAGSAIDLQDGGTVTNEVHGTISVPSESTAIYSNTPATVINSGVVLATGALSNGMHLDGSSFATNASTGHVTGTTYGIKIGQHGTVVNSGTIIDTGGISLVTVINSHNVTINEGAGISSYGYANAVVTNAATAVISGYYYGAELGIGAFVTNAGTITGNIGLAFRSATSSSGTTLINSGTIIGHYGTAVIFGGTGNNRLVLDPGFSFSGGVVTATATASNTLELASASSAGTVSSLGTKFLNFNSIDFDPGSRWFVSGSTHGLAGTISGFALGDTIEVTGITATGSSYAGGILTLFESGGSTTLHLPGAYTNGNFVVTNVVGGTDVSLAAPCFVAGTRIHTERGEIPVEALRKGDQVLAYPGNGQPAWRPIVWIGYRKLDCRRHPKPRSVWPVCISEGAFGPALPRRDLWLSPDHAVFVDGALIPVKHLINGTSITQIAVDTVTYYHVELPQHQVLLAEDLPVESYLDAGDRSAFENGDRSVALHPDFGLRAWEAKGCAPLVVAGPQLDAVRQRLNASASANVEPHSPVKTANSPRR